MAYSKRVTVLTLDGLARFTSRKKASQLVSSGRAIEKNGILHEAYAFAVEELFRTSPIVRDKTIRGGNDGWEITDSAGMPVWQWIPGGWFAPIPRTP